MASKPKTAIPAADKAKSDLVIVYRDPTTLIPYARNARTHSPEQIEHLRASIREFGFTNPILLKDDDETIGAGHGRALAAIAEGLPTVPTITLPGLTAAQWRAYVIADNRLALGAGWDEAMLRLELSELKGLDFDLSLTGFDSAELAGAMAFGSDVGQTDPDEAPEPPATPVSRLGDVWLLGNHRLMCGDSTDAETVAAVLAGATPHLMVTDPPYGVNYDAEWRVRAGVNMATDAGGKVMNDDRADWCAAWALFSGDVVYVWHAGLFAQVVADSLEAEGFVMRSQVIWAKQQLVMSRGDYHWQHEPCWYAVRKGKKGHYDGGRKQSTLWAIDKPRKSETGHSTQKPVECMKRPIENNSKPGDAVYEPFSGSGSTIIAGEMTGRRVHAIELSPAYVDVAVIRWQNFTGQEATLESTGKTFAQVKANRAASAGSVTSDTPTSKPSKLRAGATAPI